MKSMISNLLEKYAIENFCDGVLKGINEKVGLISDAVPFVNQNQKNCLRIIV